MITQTTRLNYLNEAMSGTHKLTYFFFLVIRFFELVGLV